MLSEKIMFIGGGLMATGIIGGLVNSKTIDPKNILVCEIVSERLNNLQKTYGITPMTDMADGIRQADMVVIALKPQDALTVGKVVAGNIKPDGIVLSICAGITLGAFADVIGADKKIIRTMPHAMTEVQYGVTGICYNENCQAKDKEFAEAVMNSFGSSLVLNEKDMDIFTGFNAVGPLWVLSLITAMVNGGCNAGFSRVDALNFTLENIIGAVGMVNITGKHPVLIRDMMTSPAGVTIQALYDLEYEGFYGVVMDSIQSSCQRTIQMSKA